MNKQIQLRVTNKITDEELSVFLCPGVRRLKNVYSLPGQLFLVRSLS